METIFEHQNIRFHIVPNKAFKTITIVVKIRGDLTRETITKRALLPYVLRQGPAKYPTRRDLQLKLDHLYGARLSLDGSKKGDNHIITLRLDTANQKYISDESSILEEAIQLSSDVLFNPNVTVNGFKSDIIQREKETLRKKLLSIYDDKMAYANMRLIDEMCKEEPYHLHAHGYEDDLGAIQSDTLYEYYQQMLTEDDIDVYVLGDVEKADVQDQLFSSFQRRHKLERTEKASEPSHTVSAPNTVIDEQAVQQAKLHIGYRTYCTYSDDDYGALHVFNGLFGGFPSSKLFVNVREKNSLAYYAASRIESHKGLLLVFCGIAPEDYNAAKTIISEQLEAMKQGDFTERELEETKELIVNQLMETMDHPKGLIEMLYQQVLAHTKLDPKALIDRIKAVEKSAVARVAKQVELDTVYLLTRKGGGHGE
ncbi:EF-P 5-aminopentanol modification-associated protein YfmF [Lentibacillus saliphilus]|uniref:EF-P 5-aminopentanol modification-associated protein YfmF n=1 Tax=Lentibacillus saliphilus TaxID=2737028 RepID=UPI001C2F1249|nr:pitrilysin family protein [Lentibacillus saliphilus]